MLNRLRLGLLVLAALGATSPALAKAPIEAFSATPTIRAAELSPDGKHVAYLNRISGIDYLAMYDFDTGKNQALIKVPEANLRSVEFLNNNYIVVSTSDSTTNGGFTDRYTEYTAFAYSLQTHKVVELLKGGTEGLWTFQTGGASIVGVDPDGQHVFMAAFMDHAGSKPSMDLIRVSLDTGRGVRVPGRVGSSSTRDWILDAKGNVIAREDYIEQSHTVQIIAYDPKGGARTIYSQDKPMRAIEVVGLSKKDGALVVLDRQSNFLQLFELSLADGSLSGPLMGRKDADIEDVLRDKNESVVGVGYSGMYPSYELYDAQVNADIKAATKALPDAAVSLASWSEDWSKILLLAEGGAEPSRYMVFDRAAKKLSQVARPRPDVDAADLGEVQTIEYKSRDGLKISGLVTWPASVPTDKRKNLPLVVMPHGGPADYDRVGFNFLAQFLANEGYMVLQPNFRGSTGFGGEFLESGYHQWGRKMQDDITDGVKATQTIGWADPKRTCIFGWSYGGYAALEGAVSTPDLYKCVAAVAGVSDLRAMLNFERHRYGPESEPFLYWSRVIGDPDDDKQKDAIDNASPMKLAAKVSAPVLLIHGTTDTTVPPEQSDKMEQALKAAGKSVAYVRIPADDHQLSNLDDRKKVLSALSDFLAKYLKESD